MDILHDDRKVKDLNTYSNVKYFEKDDNNANYWKRYLDQCKIDF